MTIRTKLGLGVLALSVILGGGIGLAAYWSQAGTQEQAYLEGRLLLVTSLAASLDGDALRAFPSQGPSHPEYPRLLNYLHQVRHADPFITYLFTAVPTSDGGFVYAVDGEVNEVDTVWVEGEGIALIFRRTEAGVTTVEYRQRVRQGAFAVALASGPGTVSSRPVADGTEFLLNGALLVRSRAGDPWVLETPDGLLSAETPEVVWGPMTATFTTAGSSSSNPGSPMIDSSERLAEYRRILEAGNSVILPGLRSDAYGTYREVVGVVRDRQGAPAGLVFLDVYEGELAKLAGRLLGAILPLVALLFVVCLGLSWFGARHLTWPLTHFVELAEKVRAGDLTSRLEFRRRDDYATVATAVNGMMDRLETMTSEMGRHALTLDYHVHHDTVTGLNNRRAFFRQIEGLLSLFSRLSDPPLAAVFFLDLDKFKEVNDTLGHDAGDALLRMVSERLQEAIRQGDQVFRLGGDEFVVLVSPLRYREDASLVADKIRAALDAPFFLAGHFVHIGVSQGISFYPHDGRDAQTLVKKADTALYESKRNGSVPVYFTAKMTEQMERAALIREDLFHALNTNQFHLVYQPIMDIRGRLVSAEALMRWNRPDGQRVSPDEFIPILEESSLIGRAGLWALETAKNQLGVWEALGLTGFSVSVNLSIRQLKDRDFLSAFEATIASPDYDPKRLYFEITETMIARDRHVLEWLGDYSSRGVPFAMDDFGTGYSSLAGITSLPIAYLKIDKHFVDQVPSNPKVSSIVRAIVQIAEAIGVVTVAEGVETAEQFEYLAGIGCARYQGYYFSKPLGPTDFLNRFGAGAEAEG